MEPAFAALGTMATGRQHGGNRDYEHHCQGVYHLGIEGEACLLGVSLSSFLNQ